MLKLELERRERLVFGSLDRMKAFRLPVNQWVSESRGAISFEHSGSPDESDSQRQADKLTRGGLRTKSAFEIITMPNVDLDMIEVPTLFILNVLVFLSRAPSQQSQHLFLSLVLAGGHGEVGSAYDG